MAAAVLAGLIGPETLVRRFLERSLELAERGDPDSVLYLDRVLDPRGDLDDLLLLALLTRSSVAGGGAVEPHWLSELDGTYWRFRGMKRKGIERGMRILSGCVTRDRTCVNGSRHPVGFPLGHVWLESSHYMDRFMGSRVLTVRGLTGGHLAVEHLETAMERPLQLEILGVVRASDPGRDLIALLERTATGRRFLERDFSIREIADGDLPPGAFTPLRERWQR
jgi:hypothetical protein